MEVKYETVTLANGRIWGTEPMANGARNVIPADGGPDEMSSAEWEEYVSIRVARSQARSDQNVAAAHARHKAIHETYLASLR